MRDVTRVISDAEMVKLKQLLRETPDLTYDPQAFAEYPKMLFSPDWLMCYRLVKGHSDPLIVKDAKRQMATHQVIVHNVEDEEEYVLDGWRGDPNEFIVAQNIKDGITHPDPRIPTGREGRRAGMQARQERQQELAQLRIRYAELTGKRLFDEPTEDDVAAGGTGIEIVAVQQAQAVPVAPSTVAERQARVKAAAKRAAGSPVAARA